eukprot:COSAG05_NODE_4407_length_1528_cov_1.557733_1_plen_107_part_00
MQAEGREGGGHAMWMPAAAAACGCRRLRHTAAAASVITAGARTDGLGFGVRAVLGEVGQRDVERGTHGRAEVGRATCDRPVVGRDGELHLLELVDNAEGGLEPIED